MQTSKKIGIIGTIDTIAPFKAIGATGISTNSSADTLTQIRSLLKTNEYGIIFLEEAFANEIEDEIEKLNQEFVDVALTILPGAKGSLGNSADKLDHLVSKAVGFNIFAAK